MARRVHLKRQALKNTLNSDYGANHHRYSGAKPSYLVNNPTPNINNLWIAAIKWTFSFSYGFPSLIFDILIDLTFMNRQKNISYYISIWFQLILGFFLIISIKARNVNAINIKTQSILSNSLERMKFRMLSIVWHLLQWIAIPIMDLLRASVETRNNGRQP